MSAFAQVLTSSILSPTLLTTSATVGADSTFDPVGYIQPGVAKWEARGGGIAIGYPSFTVSVRPPSKASRIYKVTGKLSVPVLEAISGANVAGLTPAQQKAYESTVVSEFMMHERSTAAERLIMLNLWLSLFATTITASDGTPSDLTASPLRTAVLNYERPF